MSSDVIVAIIGLVTSVLVQFGGILINSKLTTYRIEQLEKKVDKHNELIERMFRLEQKVAVQEERIDTLEKEVGK